MRGRSGIWGFKAWFAVVAVAVGLGVLQIACTPTAPSTIVNINNNTNTNNNGQSGQGDPSAVPGKVDQQIASVTVNGFANGEKCPSTITPANQNKKIRLGCDLAVTVNPRNAAGQTILDDHAPPVDYFVLASGHDVVDFTQSSTNSYNGDVHSKKAGTFSFVASVKGIPTKEPQEFEVIP